MTTRSVFSLLISLFLAASVSLAQQTPLAPVAPPAPGEPFGQSFSLFIDGGSFLGVYAEDINKENMARYGLREARGAGITSIVKDSPAEKAGLKKDDVILRFDGETVTSVRKLNRLVSEVAPDQTVRLGISRSGSEQEVAVTIGKRKDSMDAFNKLPGLTGKLEGFEGLVAPGAPGAPGARVWKWEGPDSGNDGFAFAFGNSRRIGVSTTQLTKQLAEFFGVADGKGVLVTSVGDDSPAAKAGIRAGDVITAVDGEKIEDGGDLTRALGKKKDGDVTLTIVRDKHQRSISVTPKEASPTIGPAGTGPRAGRQVIIPRINLPNIPPINIMIPGINLPTIPEIHVNIEGLPRGRGKTISVSQPI